MKIVHLGESEGGNPQTEDDKLNKVDVIAQTSDDEIILIELQVDNELDYFRQMHNGVGKTISQYIKSGENYEKIRKGYSVNIVYDDVEKGQDYVYHVKSEFRGLRQNDVLSLNQREKEQYAIDVAYKIDLEYYILKVNNFNNNIISLLDHILIINLLNFRY